MNNSFHTKQFVCGDTKLSREDLESMPCPFCTDKVSDEDMQLIANLTEQSTRQTLSLDPNGHIDFGNDVHREIWWKELEQTACYFKIPYYEDME